MNKGGMLSRIAVDTEGLPFVQFVQAIVFCFGRRTERFPFCLRPFEKFSIRATSDSGTGRRFAPARRVRSLDLVPGTA